MNFSGYSLGGSLAEESYLYLYKKYESKVDTLGGLKLYNPYHDNLSKKEVKTLKNSDSFELYCAEGDMVSAMFNFDDFKDEANYIYVDYTSLIEEDLKSKDISSFNLPDWTNFLLESEIVGVNQNDLKNLNNIINNFSLIFSCAHSIEAVEAMAAVAFYNDGSLREMIGNHEVVGVSFSDVSKNIFGCDVVDYIIDTIKNIFDSHIGDVY